MNHALSPAARATADPDLELVARCKADDQDAWRELVAKYQPLVQKVVKLASSIGRDAEDASSIAHRTVLSCVRRFRSDAGVLFFSYLYRSMRLNVLKFCDTRGPIRFPISYEIEQRRERQAKIRCVGLTDKVAQQLEWRSDDSTDERLEWLQAGIDQLDQRHAAVLRLRLDGASFSDCGLALGVSKQAIDQMEKRAIACLTDVVTTTIRRRMLDARNRNERQRLVS